MRVQARTSHGERDVAVVLGDIALEDVGAGSHHTFKALAVQFDTPQCALRHHCGCPRTVQQQRHFTLRHTCIHQDVVSALPMSKPRLNHPIK